jgi:hypothetical protein
MSVREELIDLGDSALQSFDKLVNDGIYEEDAARIVILSEYKETLKDTMKLNRELSIPNKETREELQRIESLIKIENK